VVSLELVNDNAMVKDAQGSKGKSSQGVESPVKKILKETFQERVKNILTSDVSQPILKLDKKNEPTPQEAFELLSHATQVLRERKFAQHEKARVEIEKRVHVLKLLKLQQLKEISELQKEKETIRNKAEQLAEKIEETFEVQNSLMKRSQEIVRLATLRLPKGSFSEKKYSEAIQKIALATKALAKNMEVLKQKRAAHELQLDQKQKAAKERNVVLPPRQEEIVKQILTEL
jgi:nuclear pore complex protein Nup88